MLFRSVILIFTLPALFVSSPKTEPTAALSAVPELLCIALTAVLHVWKRNNLLSIGVGTAAYMILIQTVFA